LFLEFPYSFRQNADVPCDQSDPVADYDRTQPVYKSGPFIEVNNEYGEEEIKKDKQYQS
jgi:hypothetical protein